MILEVIEVNEFSSIGSITKLKALNIILEQLLSNLTFKNCCKNRELEWESYDDTYAKRIRKWCNLFSSGLNIIEVGVLDSYIKACN